MSEKRLVPVVPPEQHPYMADLYGRTMLTLEATADQVLEAASAKWQAATDVGDRAETAELLLGRRIDGQELNSLPAEFRDHMFDGGDFVGLVAVMSQIAETEQSR